MSLTIRDLSFAWDDNTPVLQNLFLEDLPAGKLTVLLGPNAAGKSTLFRTLSGLLTASSGEVMLNGEALNSLSRAERLQRVCYMPQTFASQAMLSVFEVVLLARKNLQHWRVSQDDLDAVQRLLNEFGIAHLAQRHVAQLSGGQQQVVSLCQAMARSPAMFLLDEPTSALDLARQLQIMQKVREETARRNSVSIIALHDLSLAARYADHIIVMTQGQIRASGPTEEVFASDCINETYGLEIELLRDRQGSLVVSARL